MSAERAKVDVHADSSWLVIGHPVHWADHDQAGHVNNVTFMRWFEQARVNLFNHSLLIQHDHTDDSVEVPAFRADELPLLVVAAIDKCRFVRQVKWPLTQEVDLASRIESFTPDNTGFVVAVRIEDARTGDLLFFGEARLTFVGPTGAKMEMPTRVRQRLEWYKTFTGKRNLFHRFLKPNL